MTLKAFFYYFLMAALLVSCSTGLKPMHFVHGKIVSPAPIVQTTTPQKTTTNLYLRGENKKGAQMLLKQTPQLRQAPKVTETPAPAKKTNKWGLIVIYYTVVAMLAFIAYKWLTKSQAKRQVPPVVAPLVESAKPPV